MQLKKAVLSTALALLTALSPAAEAFADEGLPAETAAEQAASQEELSAESDTLEVTTDGEAEEEVPLSYVKRAVDAAAEKAAEEEFLDRNPELRELGNYVFQGDTVPCSENDPSYHKYIHSLMQNLGSDAVLSGQLTSMAGIRLLTSTITGADKLVHQARFKDLPKTYGIDVSYFQGAIDWNKVKASGVSFAILRLGYRGYGRAGTLVLDDRFLEYLAGAKKAGLDVGVYFYTQAITVAEAREEADFVYKYIKNYDLELPVYNDMETVEGAVGRLDASGLSRSQKTDLIEAFCDRIKSYGYSAGVYSNPQWLTYYLDASRLQAKYPLWLANYTTETKYTGDFEIWQYGAGHIDGVSSALTDLNVKYIFATVPDAPKNLKLASSVTDKATLSWSAVSGCSGYEVFKLTPGGVTASVGKVTGTSAAIKLSSALCTYFVKAYNTVSGNIVYGASSTGLKLASYTPVNFKVSKTTDSALTFKWDKLGVDARYDLYMYNSATSSFIKAGSTTADNVTVSGLADATVYRFKLKAVTKSGSSYTVSRTFTDELSAGTLGKKITGLKFVSKTANSITVKWDKTSSTCTGYQVIKYNSATGASVAVGTTNQTQYTVTGLTQGTAYQLKVRSYYKNGSQTIYSYSSDVLSCATKCAAPTNVKVTSTASSYTLSWVSPVGSNGFMIYAAPYGSTPVKLAETTENQYTVSGLEKGIYSVYIRPYIKCSGTRYYGVSSETVYPVCGAEAAAISSSNVTEYTADITWTKPEYAASYEAYLYDSTTKTWVRKATLSASAKKYTFTGLSAATDYKLRLKTVFTGGTSLNSNTVSVRTLTAPKPLEAPTGIKATTATNDSVTIIWNKADTAAKYKVYLYNKTAGKYYLKGTVTNETFTYTGLKQSKIYKIRVYSVSPTGAIKGSSTYEITPKPVAPTLRLSTKTETTVTLTWNATPLCSKYYIYKLDPLKNTYVKLATVTGTTYTVKGLKKGTRNIFKIKSVAVTNAANFNSYYSSKLSVLTKGLKYYPACPASSQTLYQGLAAVGVYSTYELQEKIAEANAVAGYTGTAEENLAMLQKLKNGKLIMPQY